MTDFKQVSTTATDEGQNSRNVTFKVTSIIWLLLGLLEGALGLRFLFMLLGANPANTFAKFLYGVTGVFVAPFASLVGAPELGQSRFEGATLIAMIVYALAAWALERIIYVIFYRPHGDKKITQTSVAEHTPALGTSQTTTTQTPISSSQTTVTTDRTDTQTPGTL